MIYAHFDYRDGREPASETRLLYMQRERGICSVAECDQPIAGWCAECDAQEGVKALKLCAAHLMAHCEAAGHAPYLLYERPAPHLDYDGGEL